MHRRRSPVRPAGASCPQASSSYWAPHSSNPIIGAAGTITNFTNTDEIEEHGWIDSLPPGVKFPAPNFAVSGASNAWNFDTVATQNTWEKGSVVILYKSVDYPQQDYGWSWGIFSFENIKLIEGNEQDLLVFDLRVKQDSDSPYNVRQESLKMYDGKDRWFTPITSTISKPMTSDVDNPAFGWNETCPLYEFWGTNFQAGIKAKMKFCFEIPKDSDHFKVTYTESGKNYQAPEIPTGFAFAVDRTYINVESFAVVEPTVEPTEPTSTSIELLFIALAVVAVSGIVGAVLIAKRGTNTKSAQQKLEEYEDEYLKAGNQTGNQDLEEYEKEYLARQGQRPSPKPARVEKTTLFCDSCGTPFKSEARFCGECGTPRS